MAEPLRVLCVHGIGNHHVDLSWQRAWQDAIVAGIHRWDPAREVSLSFPLYDDIFDAHPITVAGTVDAALQLLGSGIVHGIGDLFRPRAARAPISEKLRWTAGMVVQWAENETLRRQLRDRVLSAVRDFRPDVVCAHSLGSLASYDAFIQSGGGTRNPIRDAVYLSFGSQIGHPFVRAQFAGRIVPLECRRWFHLFNAEDDVFTARIHVKADNFEQVETFFDLPDPLDHDAGAYLQHANTVNRVWASISGGPRYKGLNAARSVTTRPVPKGKRRAATKRALLVGINQYPDPKDRLEGCVNDVFEMSAMLQECGFGPEDIRVVLDERATADGIRSRLSWLLEGAGPRDERVFFYSGHGAQLPEYAADEQVDHVNECLAPWDFDWSIDHAITDDALTALYSQLDYETHFLVMLDCCHSGGMARDGGARVRGLNPPDDIRHRALRWNMAEQMWEARELPSRVVGAGAEKRHAGRDEDTMRLGRGARLRLLERPRYQRLRTRLGHKGPYMPVIIQACGEAQLTYEYRHGVTSYGAFTYALNRRLRDRARKRGITFAGLCKTVGATLGELGYDQRPEIDGPKAWVNAAVPWLRTK